MTEPVAQFLDGGKLLTVLELTCGNRKFHLILNLLVDADATVNIDFF
jgi:hypothetical protein